LEKTTEQRNPLFVFVFDDVLFRFRFKTPAFVSLFQLPPRRKHKSNYKRSL